MANHLINIADIYTITGLDDEDLASYIPYAEAQAEEMLGFLKQKTKTQEIYVFDTGKIIQLDFYPIDNVSSIKYKSSAGSSEEVYGDTEYRVIPSRGMIIMDNDIPEGYSIKVEYDIGWTQTTVTDLVKILLCILVVNQYYSLRPDLTMSSRTIVSEKIGDYSVKYADMTDRTFTSYNEWADYIATLIRKGGNIPDID